MDCKCPALRISAVSFFVQWYTPQAKCVGMQFLVFFVPNKMRTYNICVILCYKVVKVESSFDNDDLSLRTEDNGT